MPVKFFLLLLLAVCSLLYGVCIKKAGSGTKFYLVWMALAALFFLCAVGRYAPVEKRLPGVLQKTVLCVLSVFLLSFLIVEGQIIRRMHAKGQPSYDYVIVLGAQMRIGGPSAVLRSRLDRALLYLNENPDTTVIVSGGRGANEPCTEAEGMRDYLIAHGIEKSRILCEAESKTTAENIRNSKKLIESGKTIGIVTNNFHMFRALQTAKAEGLMNVSGISAPSKIFYLPNNMLREYFAEVKFLLLRIRKRK